MINILDDIRAQDITIADVRQKIRGHALLSSIDAKRVCDKVRSIWKFGNQNSSEILDEIPSEQLSDKIERLFEKEDANSHAAVDEEQTSQASTSDQISHASKSSTRIFTNANVETLISCCKSIIQDGRVLRQRMVDALNKTKRGQALLDTFKLDQLQTRLKYERLKHVKKTKNK